MGISERQGETESDREREGERRKRSKKRQTKKRKTAIWTFTGRRDTQSLILFNN